MDHGATMGPMTGIEDIPRFLRSLNTHAVSGVILHKGQIRKSHDVLQRHPRLNVIMHLSASVQLSPHVNQKVLVATVQEAARMGVDAVSVHVNLGVDGDCKMLADLGGVSEACAQWNMPLIAMMYCRGKAMDEHDCQNNSIAARVAMELGADVVKVNYTGSVDTLRRVVDGAGIPVVISGGPRKTSLREMLEEIADALHAGASGVAIGRNFFQSERPHEFSKALELLVHHGLPVDEVLLAITQLHASAVS